MADGLTNNRSLTLPQVGGDSGTWGNVLNSGTFTQVDLVLGNTQSVSVTSADITLTQTQWNNLGIATTGTLTGAHTAYLPFSPNSTTAAVGGLFVLNNNNTGSFSLTLSTTASGASGVVVPQGMTSLLYSDQTNVRFADESAARFTPVNGNPNGQLAGTAATAVNPPHPLAFDYSGGTGAWVPTSTGTSTSTVWAQIAGIGASLPVPEGYLTPVSGTPIITSDSTGATVLYYTPFEGAWALIHNGTQIIPYQFSQMSLTLTSSQAANGIYDMYLAYNSGSPVIGTAPNWTSGTGGSVTAGSCARGTGVGGAAIARTQGVWTNSASMSLIYNTGSGNNTITVPANQGIYLGSLFIDGTAGQVTCHRSFGQNRKWGIWNAYNRTPVKLLVGDPNASWTYATNTIRASNNAPSSYSATSFNVGSGVSCNGANIFAGLAEEQALITFVQSVNPSTSSSTNVAKVGIGLNSITAMSGKTGQGGGSLSSFGAVDLTAMYSLVPSLGLNIACELEATTFANNTMQYLGTIAGMQMVIEYNG